MTTTWFITGASRGMGRLLVEQALERGDTVAATARRPTDLDDLATRYGARLWRRALDVPDTTAMRQVVARAFDEVEAHRRRRLQCRIRGVRRRRGADRPADRSMIRDQLTASISWPSGGAAAAYLGRRPSDADIEHGRNDPSRLPRCPSPKWGIEGFYDALAVEVEPFGIHTTLIEPGGAYRFFDAAAPSGPQRPVSRGPGRRCRDRRGQPGTEAVRDHPGGRR